MLLKYPINNVNPSRPIVSYPGMVYISQEFGEDPIAIEDTYYGKFLVKKGEHVYSILAGMKGHNGIDIAAPLGTPIIGNVIKGEAYVIYQSHDIGYGNTTVVRIIDTDKNYVQIFGHQQKFEPDVEIVWNWHDKSRPFLLDKVYGYVNSTGASTGNHLHWGIQEYDVNGNKLNTKNGFGGALDPKQFMKEKTMKLVKNNGTVYLVAGKDDLKVTGIADEQTLLAFFGDEPIEDGMLPAEQSLTLTPGFVAHKK